MSEQPLFTDIEKQQWRELWAFLNPGKQWNGGKLGKLPPLTKGDRRRAAYDWCKRTRERRRALSPEQVTFRELWLTMNPGKRFPGFRNDRPWPPLSDLARRHRGTFAVLHVIWEAYTPEQRAHRVAWEAAHPGRRFPGFREGKPWPALSSDERRGRRNLISALTYRRNRLIINARRSANSKADHQSSRFFHLLVATNDIRNISTDPGAGRPGAPDPS